MNDHLDLFSLVGRGMANNQCSICKWAATFMAEFWKVKNIHPLNTSLPLWNEILIVTNLIKS